MNVTHKPSSVSLSLSPIQKEPEACTDLKKKSDNKSEEENKKYGMHISLVPHYHSQEWVAFRKPWGLWAYGAYTTFKKQSVLH